MFRSPVSFSKKRKESFLTAERIVMRTEGKAESAATSEVFIENWVWDPATGWRRFVVDGPRRDALFQNFQKKYLLYREPTLFRAPF